MTVVCENFASTRMGERRLRRFRTELRDFVRRSCVGEGAGDSRHGVEVVGDMPVTVELRRESIVAAVAVCPQSIYALAG